MSGCGSPDRASPRAACAPPLGDGCAAALVTADTRGVALDGFQSFALPESADLITWDIGDTGFSVGASTGYTSIDYGSDGRADYYDGSVTMLNFQRHRPCFLHLSFISLRHYA